MNVGEFYSDAEKWPDDALLNLLPKLGADPAAALAIQQVLQLRAGKRAAETIASSSAGLGNQIDGAAAIIAAQGRAQAEAGQAQAQQAQALVEATRELAATSRASGRYARGLFWATGALAVATVVLTIVAGIQAWLIWAARASG